MVGLEKLINWLVQLDDWLYYRNRKSKDEIAKITKPQLQYNFEADGVFVKEN